MQKKQLLNLREKNVNTCKRVTRRCTETAAQNKVGWRSLRKYFSTEQNNFTLIQNC